MHREPQPNNVKSPDDKDFEVEKDNHIVDSSCKDGIQANNTSEIVVDPEETLVSKEKMVKELNLVEDNLENESFIQQFKKFKRVTANMHKKLRARKLEWKWI